MSQLIRAHKGSILTGLAALLVLVGLFAAGYSSMNLWPRAPLPYAKAKRLTPPSTGEIRLTLHRAGLDAEALAACGLSANDATAVVTAGRSQIASSIETLRSTDADLCSAAATRDRLLHRCITAEATPEERSTLASAESAVTYAQTAFQTAIDAVFTAATGDLSSDTKTLLQTLLANRPRPLPTRYLTAARNDGDWSTLNKAVANKKVTTRTGEQADPTLASALESFDTSSAVSTANSNLQSNLSSVTAAWNSATE